MNERIYCKQLKRTSLIVEQIRSDIEELKLNVDLDIDFFDEDYDRLNRNLGITKQQEEAFKGYKFNTFKINATRNFTN